MGTAWANCFPCAYNICAFLNSILWTPPHKYHIQPKHCAVHCAQPWRVSSHQLLWHNSFHTGHTGSSWHRGGPQRCDDQVHSSFWAPACSTDRGVLVCLGMTPISSLPSENLKTSFQFGTLRGLWCWSPQVLEPELTLPHPLDSMCAQQFCEAGNWVWTVWKRYVRCLEPGQKFSLRPSGAV